MRGKSHISMGQYLLQKYLPELPTPHRHAFLLGCIEPDRNPFTYFKGSVRCQWMRGHNYRNARRYMRRISHRLEQKTSLNVLDYYTLGKLIHYTADAFTFPHNDTFPHNLSHHRSYEAALQDHFLSYLQKDPQIEVRLTHSIMEGIGSYHREYGKEQADICRDSRFALQACCCVLAVLLTPKLI